MEQYRQVLFVINKTDIGQNSHNVYGILEDGNWRYEYVNIHTGLEEDVSVGFTNPAAPYYVGIPFTVEGRYFFNIFPEFPFVSYSHEEEPQEDPITKKRNYAKYKDRRRINGKYLVFTDAVSVAFTKLNLAETILITDKEAMPHQEFLISCDGYLSFHPDTTWFELLEVESGSTSFQLQRTFK